LPTPGPSALLPHDGKQHRRYVLLLRAIGLSLLFSGVALLTYILARISLRLALAVAAIVPIAVLATSWLTLLPPQRARLAHRLKTGILAGLLATGAYDLTKFMLSQFESSRYQPFELMRVFGVLLLGAGAPVPAVYAAGVGFHVMNGVCFAVAYWLLFGRYGVKAAIFWGLFLEVFQLTLYPGWLQIKFYKEFVQISAASHLVYGTVLGFGCRWLNTRLR
jgi:hypothetical protein